MSHQDDLEMEYKSASNELPSELSDQIILQAAKDAITPEKPKSNVVKGKFSSRKWHMPLSIAAAAVITVSVVTSLQPWNIIPVNSPTPFMSEEPRIEETFSDSASVESNEVQLREKEFLIAQERAEQKADRQTYKKRAKAQKDAERRVRSAAAPTAQKQEADIYFDDEIFLEAELLETEVMVSSAAPISTATIKSLTILEWLDEIETDIRNNDATKVKEKTLM